MLKPADIRVNRQRMGEYEREHVVEGGEMVFSWALDTDRPEAGQTAYRVIVSDEQLSLAIGKEGQNARLAAKLTGFKIDIKSYKTLSAQE